MVRCVQEGAKDTRTHTACDILKSGIYDMRQPCASRGVRNRSFYCILKVRPTAILCFNHFTWSLSNLPPFAQEPLRCGGEWTGRQNNIPPVTTICNHTFYCLKRATCFGFLAVIRHKYQSIKHVSCLYAQALQVKKDWYLNLTIVRLRSRPWWWLYEKADICNNSETSRC